MKILQLNNKTNLLLALLIFGTISLSAQSNCSAYYPMVEGSSFQYTMYNAKGKEAGVTDYLISDIKDSGGETSATFRMDFSNNKGKKEISTEYNITCTGSGIRIDFISLMPGDMKKQYEEMDIETDFSGVDIELPNDLSVGQDLKDANVTMKMSMGGIDMKIVVDIINRKVEAKESITTAAGTFDCYQLSETIKSQVMGATFETVSKTWLSKGIGMVKNETFKKNGKSDGSTVLTKYNN